MNSQLPFVTIGMPILNEEKHILKALDSILNQTYPNIDVIISDNRSDDNTSLILRDIKEKDPRVTVYNQKIRIGPYENFEFVRDKANGEYFMWHAGDDYLEPSFVSILVNKLMDTPGAICAMSDVKFVNEEGDFLHCLELNSVRKSKKSDLLNTMHFFKNPTDTKYMCIYGIFDTNVVKKMDMKVGGNLKFNRGSEIPQLAQAALHGAIVSVPEALKNYRQTSQSLFTSEEKTMKSFKSKLLNYLNLQRCLFWVVFNAELFIWKKIALYVFLILYPFYYSIKKLKKLF